MLDFFDMCIIIYICTFLVCTKNNIFHKLRTKLIQNCTKIFLEVFLDTIVASCTGCEISSFAKGMQREEKKCRDLEEERTNEKMLTRLRKKKPRPQGSRVEVFEILFPSEITPSTHDARVAAWSQPEWRNYLQSVTGLRGLCRPGHSFLFFLRLSRMHAHQHAHVFTR